MTAVRTWSLLVALSLLAACGGASKSSPNATSGPGQPAPAPVPAPVPALAPTGEHPKAALPLPPLRIAYSDWPGWVAWDIATAKNYFKEAGVDVSLLWLEYVPSMEAFSQNKADAVCMTNGDALVLAGSGAKGVGILLNDYSNGNDMLVAAPHIAKLADLRGKKIGVEVGFVDHLLLLQALRSVGLTESDVEIVNERTHKTPALLASGAVSAIAAWQPNSGQALEQVHGSKAIFTSANIPGLIYDLLFVQPRSLQERRSEWKKVVEVWDRVAHYIRDPATRADAIQIMSARVGLAPAAYAKFVDGTFILDLDANRQRFAKAEGFASVYGSSAAVDRFNIENHIYKEPQGLDAALDPSLVAEAIGGRPELTALP
jgi:NitT/TauT family transport system substrate-binding protein